MSKMSINAFFNRWKNIAICCGGIKDSTNMIHNSQFY